MTIMKVLHVSNNYPSKKFPIFGIFVKEQIDSLNSIGITNDLHFCNGFEKGRIEYLKSILELRKILKTNQYDIIHCHHALSALLLLLTFHTKQNNVIISYQNDPQNEHGIILFRLLKYRFKNFIFKNNSKYLSKLNGNGYYLPNGVDTDFFKPMEKTLAKNKLGLDINTTYILFVSSNKLRHQKRLDRFEKIITLLKEKSTDKKIEPIILTNVNRELMPFYFNAASLHLLTSDFEGSPNSVKESMACNTPVVSTPVGADNCFVSKSFEANELAILCEKALNISGNSRNIIISNKLDMQSVADKLKGIYTEIIKRNQEKNHNIS